VGNTGLNTMVKGEAVMAVAIKPLRRRRRTTQSGKSMSQSQRWGKVVTTMPVPEGDITTTEILEPEVVEGTDEPADTQQD
jgi:hypothetical protein